MPSGPCGTCGGSGKRPPRKRASVVDNNGEEMDGGWFPPDDCTACGGTGTVYYDD